MAMNKSDKERLRQRARTIAAGLPTPALYREHADLLARVNREMQTNPRVAAYRDVIANAGKNFGHGLGHAEAVARDTAVVALLETRKRPLADITPEWIIELALVAGLLHDIRRSAHRHAVAGALEADRLLSSDEAFSVQDRTAVVTAIRNHEAFKDIAEPPDPLSSVLSDALYDADKFRWGPDNFTHTLWQMIEARGKGSLRELYGSFLANLEYIGRISETFRSGTGRIYGPEFINQGLRIGQELYEEIRRISETPRMEVITDLADIEGRSHNAVVTLGNFDGLHMGHQELVKAVIARARERNGTSVAFTFHPHPLKVLAPESCPPLISTYEEKVALFEELGVDLLVILPFTQEFACMAAEEFARTILRDALDAREVHVGFNYRFGKNREGDVGRLREFGRSFGFDVVEIPEVSVDGEIVSSTKIRDLLRAGDVEHAAKLLGRSYAVTGTVVEGDKRGRTLGFPTANLDPKHEILPYPGVYAVRVFLETRQFDGIVNVGYRPTFDKHDLCVEAHVFDFSEDVYGKEMTIFFIRKIRNEMRFGSVEELVGQLNRDVRTARNILTRISHGGS